MPGGEGGPTGNDGYGGKDEGDRARDAANAQPGGVGGFGYGSAGGGTGGNGRASFIKDAEEPKSALQNLFDAATGRVRNAMASMTGRPSTRELVGAGWAGDTQERLGRVLDGDKALADAKTQADRARERGELLDGASAEDGARVRASVTAARRNEDDEPEATLGSASLASRVGYSTGNRRTGLFGLLGG